MSVDRNYYAIAGYDLTKYKTDKYDDWRWTDEGEGFTCYQRKGKIQLFDDPMSENYLYLGYIFGGGDQYDFSTVKFSSVDVSSVWPGVYEALEHLKDTGVVEAVPGDIDYGVIVFEECT